MQREMKESKLVLLGNGGVGKTAYLYRLLGNHFIKRYFPEREIRITPVVIETPEEVIKFRIWTPPGQDLITGIKEEVFTGADGIIIMLSDSAICVRELAGYKKLIAKYCPTTPVIILFNKCELPGTEKLYNKLLEKESYPIMKTSCKNNLNIYDPLFEFARILKNKQ